PSSLLHFDSEASDPAIVDFAEFAATTVQETNGKSHRLGRKGPGGRKKPAAKPRGLARARCPIDDGLTGPFADFAEALVPPPVGVGAAAEREGCGIRIEGRCIAPRQHQDSRRCKRRCKKAAPPYSVLCYAVEPVATGHHDIHTSEGGSANEPRIA